MSLSAAVAAASCFEPAPRTNVSAAVVEVILVMLASSTMIVDGTPPSSSVSSMQASHTHCERRGRFIERTCCNGNVGILFPGCTDTASQWVFDDIGVEVPFLIRWQAKAQPAARPCTRSQPCAQHFLLENK